MSIFKKRKYEKKIVFHIGRPHTGSKALQFFLFENRELLKKKGILYPTSILFDKFHHPITWSIKGINKDLCPKSPEYYIKKLKTEFDESKCNVCILSSEDAGITSNKLFCKTLYKMLIDYKFEIVVYLKRQDYALESSYKQSVKLSASPFSGTIHEYMKYNLDLDYYHSLKPWVEVFGKNNVHLRPYENHVKDDVVLDFIDHLNLDINDFNYEKQKINPSLDRDALEIVRRTNKYNLSLDSRVKLMEKVSHLVNNIQSKKNEKQFSNNCILSPSARKEIISKYKESNVLVAKHFLGRDKLFHEKIELDNNKWKEYEGLTDDLLINIIIELWKESDENN
ncbi:hypothetical protein VQL36_10825 [Chengkuizengella sp. SCS-71B]|uniref:hypothetical protein n=1 Tax=Chengkuizengella sp. SCS-71B TaxID=3115290 RepID=UPI0032C23A03